MGAIEKALAEIRFQIPPQILEKVFTPVYDPYGERNRRIYHNSGAIDEQIKSKVIMARCVTDINLMGPKEVHINLKGLEIDHVDRYAITMHIPKDRMGGATIITPLAFIYGRNRMMAQTGGGMYPTYGAGGMTTPLTQGAAQAMNAMTPIADVQNAWASVIGENTIAVEGYTPLLLQGWLRALVTHDPQLTTLPGPYWIPFGEFCVLACKAYIYNFYRIDMDMGEMVGGRELGVFRDILDRYESAEEDYQLMRREKMAAHIRLADPLKKHRMVKMLFGGQG